eukprot:ANDGO_06407.mRNA.1 Splicing factor U2af small subunit A
MADVLADIFGTEKDKVNCTFYYKIGACRHGESCARVHLKPSFSETILFPHLYPDPIAFDANQDASKFSPSFVREHYELFFEDIWRECMKYGEIDELHVCENLAEHLRGNVYVRYYDEDAAAAALKSMNGRLYSGYALRGEFSPVNDFREARCRQQGSGKCDRGGFCNFLHVKEIDRELVRYLRGEQERLHGRDRSRSRSDGGGSTSARRSRSHRDSHDVREDRDDRDSRDGRSYRDSQDRPYSPKRRFEQRR